VSGAPDSDRRGLARPLGFLLLMLGFGLRLDTSWQGLAWVLILAGAAVAARGLAGGAASRSSSASVPAADGE
jgi:hypothetical protein